MNRRFILTAVSITTLGCSLPTSEGLPHKPYSLACLSSPNASFTCPCSGESSKTASGSWNCAAAEPMCECAKDAAAD